MIRRFLAGTDLKSAIVLGVVRRSASLDSKRAAEVPLEGLSDDAVLEIAARRQQPRSRLSSSRDS
jgi:hypothetical protein